MKLRGLKTFWSVMIALLMAAQIGLALHSVEHKFSSDAATVQDHCALCKVASSMAAAPAAPPIAPVEYVLAIVDPFVVASLVSAAPAPAFRSRAPPITVSA